MSYKFLCELCFPTSKGWEQIGRVCGDFWLVRHGKKYLLMSEPGHDGSIDYTFKTVPSPNPLTGMTDKQVDNTDKKTWSRFEKYTKNQDKEDFKIDLDTVKHLVQQAKLPKKRRLSDWLYHTCGVLIQKAQK